MRLLLIAQLLELATVWNGQSQSELSAPGFHLAEKVMHITSIQIGRMAGLPGGFFCAGIEIGVRNFNAAEVGLLQIALNPSRRRVGATRLDKVLADFGVPHVAESVLRQATLIAPGLEDKAIALAIIQERLEVLADCSKIASMQADTFLRKVHAPPPKRPDAEYRKSQVHFCI